MLSILSFIFVLGVLVFIHELGHFLVAKKVGIRVDRFSLGFPPNVLARKWGETTYCIGLIPLGGYVKMAGENPHEFMSKSAGRRAAVILAGPFMNYLLSIFILAGILFIFGQPLFDPERALVGEVIKGHPAFQAGLKPGDQILAIDGEPVSGFEAMRVRINAHVAEPIELTWLHEEDTITGPSAKESVVDKGFVNGQDGTGVEVQGSGDIDLVGFGRGDMDEDRHVVIVIQQDVGLDTALGSAKAGPGKQAQR